MDARYSEYANKGLTKIVKDRAFLRYCNNLPRRDRVEIKESGIDSPPPNGPHMKRGIKNGRKVGNHIDPNVICKE